MTHLVSLLLVSTFFAAEPLAPGDHTRTVEQNGQSRSYILHVPRAYDARRPTPLVLAFHGAGTNATIMALSTGLSAKADRAGFLVAYPNGTGKGGLLLIWNSGGYRGPKAGELPDDVAFVRAILDDLAKAANVDRKRVYATGISNGGMMCYRLAAELSDRIAAIAPVGGTMSVDKCQPSRPVPVLHFHGTEDKLVPFEGPSPATAMLLAFRSVDETIRTWVAIDGCNPTPQVTDLPAKTDDDTSVTKRVFGQGRQGAEVILFIIHGGGHTWPGRTWPIPWLGKTTHTISANDQLWDFFQRHPMP